jgi:ferritin
MTQRVVYNNCFGGFEVHEDAVQWMREQGDDEAMNATLVGEYYDDGSGPKSQSVSGVRREISRTNELLADMIEGETEYTGPIDGQCADLRVAEVPDHVEWTIEEHDGQETVKEKSRTFS